MSNDLACKVEQIRAASAATLGEASRASREERLAAELQAAFLQSFSMYQAQCFGRRGKSALKKYLLFHCEIAFSSAALLLGSPGLGTSSLSPYFARRFEGCTPGEFAQEASSRIIGFYRAIDLDEAYPPDARHNAETALALRIRTLESFWREDEANAKLSPSMTSLLFRTGEGAWMIRHGLMLTMPVYRLERAKNGDPVGWAYNLDDDPSFMMPDYRRYLPGYEFVDLEA